MADKTTVLTLSTTEFDRPKVSIDGRIYEMRSPDEMGVAMMRSMNELAARIKRASDPEIPPADGQADKLDDLALGTSDGVRQVMVDLPDEVLGKLTIRQQSRIILAFGQLARDDKPASATN